MPSRRRFFGLILTFLSLPGAVVAQDPDPKSLDRERLALEVRLSRFPNANPDQVADTRVFLRAVEWALRYETGLGAKELSDLTKALGRARQRLQAFESEKAAWPSRTGRLVRGFVSSIDGSVQPYGLVIPSGYDPKRPIRLDVVLHGSTRPRGLSEITFMNRFDEGDEAPKTVPDQSYIEVHPLGRVENGYRWAGETDVLEAIEAVCRNYSIDRDRIILRGMSMGASGTWHVGLKHPDTFVALGPYCGYVDTYNFSRTPLPNFIPVGPLPEHQIKTLHLIDSIDYAANAGIVPAIACMGEKDVFFQAHVLMDEAMKKEGLNMVNLISPGTKHVVDPVTHKEQMRRIADIAKKGLDRDPKHLRFVTWSLKYADCRWIRLLGLKEHYRRSEIVASKNDSGGIEITTASNITRFSLKVSDKQTPQVRIEGRDVEFSPTLRVKHILLARHNDGWKYVADDLPLFGKVPGVQGPIDDAFTAPFLCARGTGPAWNPKVQAWSEASLRRFAYEWARYFRGDLPIKDDKDVTEADVRRCNLILFGDPGSNAWITKVLTKLPIQWTREKLQIGSHSVSSMDHAPLVIQPNPLAANRYVVLNSGHTFHEKELASLNYLLFPRLGDWALMKVGDRMPADATASLDEVLIATGFCDEQWRLR